MELNFVKMHGLGNDFVVIEDLDAELDLSPEAVEWFCDRNFGVGADGLMLVRRASAQGADYGWWFRNSDGSIAEMCGNGIRCFAKYVVDHGMVGPEQQTVRVETAVGVLTVDVTRDEDGRLELATVDMGEPILDGLAIPTTLPGTEDGVVDAVLETELGSVALTCVSMGNPHAVLFVEDATGAPVGELGPVIETAPEFPRKTNVEFVEVVDAARIRMRVWERGVGETLACGTGACAAVVACVLNGCTGREVTVELLGGELSVRWDEGVGRVWMTGPAEEVFSGTLTIEDDEVSEEQ